MRVLLRPGNHEDAERTIPPGRAAKARILERLRRDAEALRGDDREIMLSFIGDPYQPTEMELELTRRSIEILIENGLRFSILTKGGTRAARDFDLLASYGKARFGSTIIFKDQEYADTWEPGAAPIQDRIEAIWQAQGKGISTWVSVEPIVSPGQAFEVIRLLHPIVDHWKVGKLNYMDAPERPNWRKVRSEIAGLLDSLGADYYIKNSLRRY